MIVISWYHGGMVTTFGKLVRSTRERRGLSQSELSRELGVSQSTLSNLELDRRTPNFDLVKKVSDFLDIHLGEYFDLQTRLTDEVERAVFKSSLSREKQDALLTVYGYLAGRSSVENVVLLRTDFSKRKSDGEDAPA